VYRSLDVAKGFVHNLNLKTYGEWFSYCQSGKKPDDIPYHPERFYAAKGWINWADWLGKAEKE